MIKSYKIMTNTLLINEVKTLLTNDFNKAILDIKTLKKTPSDVILLELYGYYKQATIGNNTLPEPSFFNFKEKSKWNAWYKLKNMKTDTAKIKYIKLVAKLLDHDHSS